MAEYEISTPVPDYTGSLGALVFTDGKARANDDAHASEIAYCRERGYTVEEVAEPAEEKTTRGRRAASTEEKPK
jgi:hypothetical protein